MEGHTLVAFTDPSLDSCIALALEWDKVEKVEENTKVVDCKTQRDICEQEEVHSFPAIRLYYGDGSFKRYRGAKKSKDIISFLRRCVRPVISELDSKNVTSFLTIDDIVFVAHLTPEDENLFLRYEDIADKYHDRFSFGRVPIPKAPSGIACYNNLDNMQHTVSVELETVEALERFVKLCSTPLVPELTRRNEFEYLGAGKSMVYYFLTTDEERDAYRTTIRPLAKKYAEYLSFVMVDANEYPEMMPMVGLQGGETPSLAVQNPRNGQVFPFEGQSEITAEVVEQFVLDIAAGAVKPWEGPGSRPAEQETAAHDEL